MKRPVFLAAISIAGILFSPCVAAGRTGGPVSTFIQPTLQNSAGLPLHSRDAVERFYSESGHRPAWTVGNRQALKDLRTAIAEVGSHGLLPRDYHAAALDKAVADKDDAAVEVFATDAYLTLAAHLLRGKVNPVSVEPDWTARARSGEVIAHLFDALKNGSVRKSLESLTPDVAAYHALQAALRSYSSASKTGDWPGISGGTTLKPGMSGPRIFALRQRLQAENLLASGAGSQVDFFDSDLEAAVAAFQRQIGLEADGVVGPLTLRELNYSKAERIAQIRANLERWRWLSEDLGRRHIRVNIADFQLQTWEDRRPVRTHDVIVGRTYRKTPVFTGDMTYVVLNPWWDTPHNIARLDKLRDFRAEPDSVERLGFEVFDSRQTRLDPSAIDWNSYSARHFPFRLRQRPGPQNAMGSVKLILPNKHSVYLHDTPSLELFDRSRRDFSSGCVRVRQALDLAEWALAETPGWSKVRIETTVASGRETRVDLARKIPVHFLYMTVVARPDGGIRFVADLYDRDSRLIAALDS